MKALFSKLTCNLVTNYSHSKMILRRKGLLGNTKCLKMHANISKYGLFLFLFHNISYTSSLACEQGEGKEREKWRIFSSRNSVNPLHCLSGF